MCCKNDYSMSVGAKMFGISCHPQNLPLGREVDFPSEQPGFTNIIKDEKWQEDKIFAQKRLAGICPYFLQQVTNSGREFIKDKDLMYFSIIHYLYHPRTQNLCSVAVRRATRQIYLAFFS